VVKILVLKILVLEMWSTIELTKIGAKIAVRFENDFSSLFGYDFFFENDFSFLFGYDFFLKMIFRPFLAMIFF